MIKTGYKKSPTKEVAKGYAKNVNVVNTPTVKIDHSPAKPMLPTLRLTSGDLPAIAKWKVGSKYTLVLDVEQTSLQQGNEYDMGAESEDSNKTSASFKVLDVKEQS